tara:strand:- start:7390 stop:8760 length:1371 start_codon:yes stop_codon:yes gene_type:complete
MPSRRHRVAHRTTHRSKDREICRVFDPSQNMTENDVIGKTWDGALRLGLVRDGLSVIMLLSVCAHFDTGRRVGRHRGGCHAARVVVVSFSWALRQRPLKKLPKVGGGSFLMPPRAKLKAPAAARAAAAPGATVEHLPEVLRALLSVENESRGIAEATLKALAKDARSGGVFVAALLQHARSDADAAVRQLAAVVLKRRVLTHWSALPVDHQEQFKNVLLEGIVSEPVPAVRRAIADVVSKVAKATVPLGAWNALPEFLAQCSASPEESHRVVAFVLFASLTETIVGTMTKHFSTLGGLFTGGLSDASSQVRVAALKAVLALVINAPGESKEETNVLSSLVVPVLAVAKHALESGEEKYGSLAFEVLDELVEQQPKALTGHIELIVAFCLEVASLGNLDNTTRRKALDVLSFLARHKPKALVKAKIVPNLIKALCPLCGEPKEDLLYGDDEVDENTG